MGKQIRSRFLASLLLLGVLCMQTAFASDALGSDIQIVDTELSHGTTLAKGVFWSSTYSDLRQEHYIAYTPNKTVLPVVSYGSKITSKSTLTTSAKALEANGSQVVAGINGDYYVVNTGVPLGIVVTEGALRSSSSYLSAIGILDDGTAFIGTPDLTIKAVIGENGQTSFDLAGMNKVRSSEGGVYLFTEDFGATTLNTKAGVDVILALPAPGADGLRIGETVTATVEQVIEATGAISLEPGKVVLSTSGSGGTWHLNTLRNLRPGNQVQISISSGDTRWNDAAYAMGGLYRLLENGKVVSNLPTGSAPRTAIGIKANGQIIFYTIDGRQPAYSIGASMSQVASRLLELGCVDAICLDGGGSTSLGVTTPDETSLELINSPSDGTQRANSTCFLLVSNTQPSGILSSFYVEPYDAILLSGATLPISAVALDTNYHAMRYDGPLSYSIQNGDGVISSDGLFTAGGDASRCTVSVSAGDASGKAIVTVIKTPGAIALYNASGKAVASLSVSPNSLTDLSATATYRNLTLLSQNACFQWSTTGGIGTVDTQGRFTAAAKSGTGTLRVSAGGTTYSIPVTVSGHVLPIESFETSLSAVSGTESAALSLQTDLDYVKSGFQSLRVSYSGSEPSPARFGTSFPIASGETQLTFWIYGDGSGNEVSMDVTTREGSHTLPVTSLDFTGWKRCAVSLPHQTTSVSGVRISCAKQQRGVLYLDHFTSSNEAVADETPPVLSLSVSGTKVTGQVKDNIDAAVSKERVSLTYDGEALAFTLDAATGGLTAVLPAPDGALHRLTLTAADVSGNFSRTSRDLGAGGGNPFADTGSHWCKPFAQYLYDHQISLGIYTAAGYTFQPDKNISRAEFALMLARSLHLDLTSTAESSLPFADAAEIPDWATGAVKAAYAAGVINGSLQNGSLLFLPNGDISRAEVSTILARTLQRGYPQGAFSFSDASAVPSWAKPSMTLLSSIGILSGYQNKIMPNDPITRGAVAKMLVSIR
ncbi:MAG: phosphodiester glycosidase family protein [Oscillospiraceae bacterium]|jgi:hypothetical protein